MLDVGCSTFIYFFDHLDSVVKAWAVIVLFDCLLKAGNRKLNRVRGKPFEAANEFRNVDFFTG